jgi:hypothetical protein
MNLVQCFVPHKTQAHNKKRPLIPEYRNAVIVDIVCIIRGAETIFLSSIFLDKCHCQCAVSSDW